MSSESPVRTGTIFLASVSAIAAGAVAYAAYFDYRRRNDPEFRRNLKREHKRAQKAEKKEQDASKESRDNAIKAAVREVTSPSQPRPTTQEEIEALFMEELGNAEKLSTSTDDADQIEAAKSYYRALDVYPAKTDLIGLYERTVPKPILDILAQMIASDDRVGAFASQIPEEELS